MAVTLFTGADAIWLNAITIGVMTFFVTNLSVSVVTSLLNQRFLNIQVKPRKALLWLLVLLPWISGLLTTTVFLYAYLSATPSDISNSYAHWHHMDEFNLINWHGATLLLFAAVVSYVLTAKGLQLKKHRQQLKLLTSYSSPNAQGIYQIPSEDVLAFTTGFLQRRCFTTTGMLLQTSKLEQEVIVRHEQAHAHMHDPLKKWLFSLFCFFFLPPVTQRLKMHMTLAMEQDADNQVLSHGLDPTLVASTLVKIAKLNARRNMLTSNDLVASFGADVLEQRVYFLLGQLELKPINLIQTGVFIALIFAISLSSIDGIHHLMEALFSH